MDEMKSAEVYEDFSKGKEMFDFSNYSAKSKYYDDSNKLAIGKMKPKIYSFLVDDSGEGVNKRCEQKCFCNNKSY